MAYFGPPWSSRFCESAPSIPVPLGEMCVHCEEFIQANDSGVRYANGPVAHKNCFWRALFGSVAHIQGRCSCFVPGSTEEDPPGLTLKEAADAAAAEWEKVHRRVQ